MNLKAVTCLGWRVVPTNNDALGSIAMQSLPAFEQIIVNCPMGVTEVEFNRKLFMARRRAEQALTAMLIFLCNNFMFNSDQL